MQKPEITKEIMSDRCFEKNRNPDFLDVIKNLLDTYKNIHILPRRVLTALQTRADIDKQNKILFINKKISVQKFSSFENTV